MPNFSRLSQALAPITFAITLAGCNITTDTSYEPETQLSDRKVVETVPKDTSNVTSPILEAKLAKRDTINPFISWYTTDFAKKDYKLFFTAQPPLSREAITLSALQWMYFYPNAPWDYMPGIEQFLTNKDWNHSQEYGETRTIAFADQAFPDFFASAAASRVKKTGSDGIWLDFWFDTHPSNQYSSAQVSSARKRLIKSLRDKLGYDKIIMGNVAWNLERGTLNELNGVFLEFVKSQTAKESLYGQNELAKIENTLNYYENNLLEPKIIAVNGWRATNVTDASSQNNWDKDRNTSENRKMAKLLTAMSVVIPTNGYIMYSDNNPDSQKTEHGHLFYDFYSFDIGKPTGPRIKVSNGVSYKKHQEGFIAYNITSRAKDFEVKGSDRTISVEPKSGLFCKDSGEAFDCLTVDQET